MAVHDGHRERLKERFRTEGLDGFTEVQVLELLLFYSVPRKDTNEIAHALLEKFGTLAQVLDANPADLEKVPGMGSSSALFLKLLSAAGRRYQISRTESASILRTVEQCGAYLQPRFFGRKHEAVFLLCMDAKCKVLACKQVGEGSVNSAGVPIRRVVETALSANATMVVLAHNHPSGLALPSADDIQTTKRLAVALDTVEITLIDHLVFSDDDYVSMAQSGYYKPGESMCVL
ncbi:MAG TPA: DNA repair protein RadC [Candidatus Faecousia excrementigallinarum]|uniref:DNA repair protein RadC n=1 Tax=Candidatus Faecousia excrementigallinarum TaxID=2840806 RepID=A0A9D0Z459_9FIRM|nr:DNA repair protein RadC [Candidatus Faecousia excrementigallinarum]